MSTSAYKNTFTSITSNRGGSTPVIGKRIAEEAEVITRNEENRFPLKVPFDKVKPKPKTVISPKKAMTSPNKQAAQKLRDISNRSKVSMPPRSASEKKTPIKKKKKQIVVSKPGPMKIRAKPKVNTFNPRPKSSPSKRNSNFHVDPSSIIDETAGEIISDREEGEVLTVLKEVRRLEADEHVNFINIPSVSDPPSQFKGQLSKLVKESMIRERDERLEKEILRQQRNEGQIRKKEQLAELDEKVRENNRRFRSQKVQHRVAWGSDQKRLMNEHATKLQEEAKAERAARRADREAKAGQRHSRLGLDYVVQLKGEIPTKRSNSVQLSEMEISQSARKPVRVPNQHIQEFMRQQKVERKEQQVAKQQLADIQNKKRETKLKQLEVINRKQLRKFKERKRRQTARQRVIRERRMAADYLHYDEEDGINWVDDSGLDETDRYSIEDEEDAEVQKIMQRLHVQEEDPYGREGRENRAFGGAQYIHDIGNSTQVCADIVEQRKEESEDSMLPAGNSTQPLPDSKKIGAKPQPERDSSEIMSSDQELDIQSYSQSPEDEDLSNFGGNTNNFSNYEPDSPEEEPSDLNRRKNELRDRLKKLAKRVEKVKATVAPDEEEDDEEDEYLELDVEDSAGTPGSMVIHSDVEIEDADESFEASIRQMSSGQNFQSTLQKEAAIKIQAAVRGFLVRCQLAHFFEMYDFYSDEDSQEEEIIQQSLARRSRSDEGLGFRSDEGRRFSDRQREMEKLNEDLHQMIAGDSDSDSGWMSLEYPVQIVDDLDESIGHPNMALVSGEVETYTGSIIKTTESPTSLTDDKMEIPISPNQITGKQLLSEFEEFEKAKKRESELEKLLEESKNCIEEQRKSALQQTLYAQQSFIEDLKKSKEQDAKKFHGLIKSLFGDQKFAVSEITSTFMKMLDQRYAHLAEKFCENRAKIQAALGTTEEMTDDVGLLTATLPPAEESILMTLMTEDAGEQDDFENEDEMAEILAIKKQKYEQLFQKKQEEISSQYEKKLHELQNIELDKMLDEFIGGSNVDQSLSFAGSEDIDQMRNQIKEIVTNQLRKPSDLNEDTFGLDASLPYEDQEVLGEPDQQSAVLDLMDSPMTSPDKQRYSPPRREEPVDSSGDYADEFSLHFDKFSDSDPEGKPNVILDQIEDEILASDEGRTDDSQDVRTPQGDSFTAPKPESYPAGVPSLSIPFLKDSPERPPTKPQLSLSPEEDSGVMSFEQEEDDSMVKGKPGWKLPPQLQVSSEEESPEISVVKEEPLLPPTQMSPEFSPAAEKRPKFVPPQLDADLFSDEESESFEEEDLIKESPQPQESISISDPESSPDSSMVRETSEPSPAIDSPEIEPIKTSPMSQPSLSGPEDSTPKMFDEPLPLIPADQVEKNIVLVEAESVHEDTLDEIEEEPVISQPQENSVDLKENLIQETVDDIFQDMVLETVVAIGTKRSQVAEGKSKQGRVPRIALPPVSEKTVDPPLTSVEPSIKTDFDTIQTYTTEIFANIRTEDIENAFTQKQQRQPLDLLCRLQDMDFVSSQDFEQLPPVLDVKMYLQMERLRKDASSREGMSPNTVQCVSEAEHIHNKMIFDTVNESLQDIRSITTANVNSMPWSTKPNSLIQTDYSSLKEEVLGQIQEWCEVEAGKIPSNDLVLSNGIVDEESLQMIREEKLATMLAQDVITMESQWVDYENEEAQVKIDLSDIVLDQLIHEAFEVLEEAAL